jgi:hypothetical protein
MAVRGHPGASSLERPAQRQAGRLSINGVSQVLKPQIQDQAGLLPRRLLRCATRHILDIGRHTDRAIR